MDRGRPARALAGHKKRWAANKKISTDPDVTTTAAMLRTVCTAVDSTIGKRPAVGAACSVRPFLDVDRFLVAIEPPLRMGQALMA